MHFCNAKQNVRKRQNAFDVKMHLMRTFCVTKCYKCILAYIFQRKMFSTNKMLQMHLMPKCIWCVAKMHFCTAEHFPKENVQRTFYEVKCSASHFPKENVQLCKNAVFFALQKTKMLCKNAFDAKMHLMPKCIWCKNAFLQRNAYILRSKMFSITFCFAKMHLMQKCIWCVHFVTQNVTNAFLQRNASTKCYKCILAYIFQRKMFSVHFTL